MHANQLLTSHPTQANKDTLRPVTIKQIVDADLPHPDADFKISGAEVAQVTFVGQIRNISQQATNYTYKIDDGTGTIEVKRWIDPEESNAMDTDGSTGKPKLVENAYVRVFGTLKAFNNKRHVGARPAGIRVVTDLNEVQMHLLEATAVHLFFERGPPAAAQNGVGGAHTNGAAATNGTGATLNGARVPPGLSLAAQKVYQCLSAAPESNEGLHYHDIAARINMDVATVQDAGPELSAAGLLYSTVDEDTWALLENV